MDLVWMGFVFGGIPTAVLALFAAGIVYLVRALRRGRSTLPRRPPRGWDDDATLTAVTAEWAEDIRRRDAP